MQHNELIEWIQLINTDGVGPVGFYKLLAKFGSAHEALQNLQSKQHIFAYKDAQYELEKAHRQNVLILTRNDKKYPLNLAQLNDAPPVLYVKGNADLLNYPAMISVVGSRSASISGQKIASKLSFDLTENEVIIVSGMARGIDTAAHKGALLAQNKQGPTIAVLGTGVDVPYPSENQRLYEQIIHQGVVISELPLGTTAQPQNFPRRNRIISALSAGTLVVEASINSGSLITARLALEQGKDIFAVPGSPLDGRSMGANKLIKEGAILTETADDILQVLSLTQNQQIKDFISTDLFANTLDKAPKIDNIPPQRKTPEHENADLLNLITPQGVELDELLRNSGMDFTETMLKITELELEGKIKRINGVIFITDTK